MALNDNAVITAAVGYVYRAPVGTVAPTPDDLDTVDPERFGAQVTNVEVSGDPTSVTIKLNNVATAAIDPAATAAQAQAAIEAVAGIGVGNTIVEGVSLADPAGLTITFLSGEVVSVTEGTYVGGTDPSTTITNDTEATDWTNVGHTSRNDMPEFGYTGGDLKMHGTWQKKRLRELEDGDPSEDTVKLTLEQWDASALELYFGEDAADEDGVFGVSGDFTPIECALLIIICDGDTRIGFYAPKASITRDSSIKLPLDDFAGLPIAATFLNLGARRLYDWISKDLLSAA